jgi:DNA recombination protein RmuC
MLEILLGIVIVLLITAIVYSTALAGKLNRLLDEKHRLVLQDLHDGLIKQGDRVSSSLTDTSERLRTIVSQELKETRTVMQSLQLTLNESFAKNRETIAQQLSDMTIKMQTKLTERLDEGFKKTNETFTNVMTRLAVIDEAQKKIDGLTTNVVSLQELLGDKRSRGAFGEIQLETLVRNIFPNNPQQPVYAFQYTFSNNSRVDCVLFLPEPTGTVAIDAKFPLENYRRMLDKELSESERGTAQRQFKSDIKKHIDDISEKYIIPNETSDGAVMFTPAEAVFAEIHAYHADLIEYAMKRRVWIASPTTLMAMLNTARAVLKDVETRQQIHIIKAELGNLGKDFARFDERMRKLADHIRQAGKDVDEVHTSSRKITQRFAQIEAVELDLENPLKNAKLENTEEDV